MAQSQQIFDELERLAQFFNWPPERYLPACQGLAAFLNDYAEWVLHEDGFELITGGKGSFVAGRLAELAGLEGVSSPVLDFFLQCHRRFPETQLGFKLSFLPEAKRPSLYVRIKAPLRESFDFLATHWDGDKSLGRLQKMLSRNDTLYGLGFYEMAGEAAIKTYTIQSLPQLHGGALTGFISYRLSRSSFSEERKVYYPHYPLAKMNVSPQWRRIATLLREDFGIEHAGHLGVISRVAQPDAYQIYVERIGSIPTDFSAS